jgi:PAS domain S-box-containing protein
MTATETEKALTMIGDEERDTARLETALQVAQLGSYEWRPYAGLIEVDARASAIFGLPGAGVYSDADAFARVAPDLLDRQRAGALGVMGIEYPFDPSNLGRTIDFEYDLIHADGTRISILSAGVIFEDPDGTRRMVGAFNDVTELRQAQAQLAHQNATLEQRVAELAAERNQLWQLSRDPFLISDLEGRWVSASPAWTEILGWQPHELIGRTSAWMEHPDDVSRTRQEIVDIGHGEITTAFVNRFRGKDGLYRTFSWTAVSKGDRLFCVARDVTHEMVRDEALRRYENIIHSDTAPICACDADYRQIVFNQAHSDDFFRTYGHRVQIGEVFPDLLLPEQASMIRGFIDRALAGEMFTITAEVGDPDMTVPHWELSYGPLKAGDGSIIGAFHHAKDVSARVQMEAELLQTQEVLRQAQKMEAVGQLTGGLAHDFKNLLTGMTGNMELLQLRVARGRLDDLDRFILAAQGAGRRAASLTQRLLAFSRRQTLDPKPTDVNRLAAGMEELLRRTVGPANEIEIIGAAGLWTANIDAGQLENALLNLCINARDAMPDGGRITIETANKWLDERAARERDLSPGQYLSVCVTDTGTGMPPEVIDRVFEPFFTTKPLGEGTGLGLSMIYGFARQSNGQVRIYSEVGIGTTVCVYLPRHLGDAVAYEEEEAIAVAVAATGETILVVDDEATIRHLIDEVLDDAGYTVIGAADGAAGIKVLQSGARIELLITDVGLPGGMNGRQVADEARRLRPGLKVLFITGYAENAAVGNGHLEPEMQLLTKPFTLDALANKVAEMMQSS